VRLEQGAKEAGPMDSPSICEKKIDGGGPLRGEEEKLADVLVRSPLFSSVVDLIGTRDQ
jgi:hypothetical protein